jgi:hypothetical protein
MTLKNLTLQQSILLCMLKFKLTTGIDDVALSFKIWIETLVVNKSLAY